MKLTILVTIILLLIPITKQTLNCRELAAYSLFYNKIIIGLEKCIGNGTICYISDDGNSISCIV